MAGNHYSTRAQEQHARELRERRRRKQLRIVRQRRLTLLAIMIFVIALVVIIIVSVTQKNKDVINQNTDMDPGNDVVIVDTQDTEQDTEEKNLLVDPNVHALENGQNYTVVLDPGHGGKDTGGAHGDVTDKSVALNLGLKLRTELQKRNINVEMTRDDDTFIKLKERVSFAEDKNADLFISLHSDSYEEDSSVHGLTVHYPYQQPERSAFASLLHDNIEEADIIRVRDLKNTDLYVIMNTSMMSTLIECGYLSNPDDLAKLSSDEFLQQLAVIIADSVVEYFESVEQQTAE